MKLVPTNKCTVRIPDADDVRAVEVGKKAPDPFGGMSPVTRIYARGTSSRSGKEYVCYYVKFGDMAEISMTLHAGQLLRDTRTCKHHTSAELNWYEQKYA